MYNISKLRSKRFLNLIKKFSVYHYLIFSFLSLTLIVNRFPYDFLLGEDGPVEIIQVLLLTLCIFFNLRYRSILIKKYKKWIYNLKIFIYFFILYEELSVLTTDMFSFLSSFNDQSQLNLHNSYILKKIILNFFIWNNDSINIEVSILLLFGSILVVGLGAHIQFLKKFSFLFFEKKFSLYVLIYPLNFLVSYIMRPFVSMNNDYFLQEEFMELILYFILLLDNFEKINLIKSKRIKNY